MKYAILVANYQPTCAYALHCVTLFPFIASALFQSAMHDFPFYLPHHLRVFSPTMLFEPRPSNIDRYEALCMYFTRDGMESVTTAYSDPVYACPPKITY